MKLVKIIENDLYDYIKDVDFDSDKHIDLSDACCSWDEYLSQEGCKIDYKWVRKNIQDMYNTIGYEGFKDKHMLAKYHVTRDPIIYTDYSFEDKLAMCINWNYRSYLCRQERMLKAETELRNRVTDRTEQTDLMNFIMSEGIVASYLQYGVEGTVEGDAIGLFDFLLSRTGTTYETTGMASKTYTVEGLADCAELGQRLYYILYTGALEDGWLTD